jgi:hypothetical protein
MYTLFVPAILSLLLALTPTLWDPSVWTNWWDTAMISAGMTGGVNFNLIFGKRERCMTRNETLVAVLAPETNVSGLYGPGTYMAWLLTSWAAAISSIAHAKCASNNPQRLDIDLELLGVIAYPVVACMDIIIRLFRCKIDASLTAAVFVVVTSLTIISPMKRLSIQREGSELFELLADNSHFLENKRLNMLRIPRWIGYGVLQAVIGEPYVNNNALITLWSLLFFVMIYSGIVGDQKYEMGRDEKGDYIKGHFTSPYRPWEERVAVFCLVQIIFSIVLVTTGNHSFWPVTSSSLYDLDQATALLLAIVTLVVSRRTALRSHLGRCSRKIMGVVRAKLLGHGLEEEAIPLGILS